MKTIIAGGRDYSFTTTDFDRLDAIPGISVIVSGGAKGADSEGERYARAKGLPVLVIEADWDTHGRAAGPIRNREMAKAANAVAIFPGGRGTGSMFSEAKKAGLKIYDFRNQIQPNLI